MSSYLPTLLKGLKIKDQNKPPAKLAYPPNTLTAHPYLQVMLIEKLFQNEL